MAFAREEIASDNARQAVTIRALALGAFLTVMATVAGSYARFILHTTRLDQNHLSVAAVFPHRAHRAVAHAAAQIEQGRTDRHVHHGIDRRDYAYVLRREIDRQFHRAPIIWRRPRIDGPPITNPICPSGPSCLRASLCGGFSKGCRAGLPCRGTCGSRPCFGG